MRTYTDDVSCRFDDVMKCSHDRKPVVKSPSTATKNKLTERYLPNYGDNNR